MWPPMSSLLPWFFQVGGVVIATGLSIKMMDDYLDKDLDLHGNLYHFLEEGSCPMPWWPWPWRVADAS